MFYFITADYITISSLMPSYLVHGSENNSVCPMPPSEVDFLCSYTS